MESELVVVTHATHGMIRHGVIDLDLALATDGLVGVDLKAKARFDESSGLLTREGAIGSRENVEVDTRVVGSLCDHPGFVES